MNLQDAIEEKIVVKQAIFPKEFCFGRNSANGVSESCCPPVSPCQGDGCNADQGGCPSDASCGQDC